MSSADVAGHPSTPMPRVAAGVVAAVLASIIVNTGIALATTSLDPDGTRIGLILIAYGPATALGVLAGTGGWVAVRRFATRPRAVLRVLVPVVVGLSFVPGIILLALGTADWVNVIGLWLMHLVVAVVTITTASRVAPLGEVERQHVSAGRASG